MGYFAQKRTKNGQLFPSPREGEVILETPPCISWLSEPKYCRYRAEIFASDGVTPVWSGETDANYIVPDKILPSGEYKRVITAFYPDSEQMFDTSDVVRFTISPDAVSFIRPTADEFLSALPSEHPRLLFRKSDIPSLREKYCAQLDVLRRNVELALADGMPTPPRYHLDKTALAYREYFGRYRDFCDRDLVACALCYQLLGDGAAGAQGKALLLEICSFSPYGACSLYGGWGDEVGLSNARVLSAAYDMLYDLLDERERAFVRQTVFIYAKQCKIHIDRIDFTQNPGNSHCGRIPAYMGQAALVLWGEDCDDIPRGELYGFLSEALDIYGGVFPYFGTSDGGWAEGPFYATSYIKWYLPFFLAVGRYTGKSYLTRPFYRNVCSFLERFARPDAESHPFCDGYWCLPDDDEWPGFFAQNPFRVYADLYGSPTAKRYRAELDAPEIYKLHLLDIFVPVAAYTNICSDKSGGTANSTNICSHDNDISSNDNANMRSDIAAFYEAGFVSLTLGEVSVLARASKFGSFSHEHPDNGSFAVLRRGSTLISPSGYFGRQYGADHHKLWTNTSAAHNVILVDGVGQQPSSFTAVGRILSAERLCGGELRTVLDMSEAYPMLTSWRRTLTLGDGVLSVADEITSERECEISWLLHTLSRPVYAGGVLSLTRGGNRMSAAVVRGLCGEPTIADRFPVDLNEGVPEQYRVEMPPQYHATYKSGRAREHRIEVKFEFCDA